MDDLSKLAATHSSFDQSIAIVQGAKTLGAIALVVGIVLAVLILLG